MPKITLRRESTKHKVELSIWINGDRHCEFNSHVLLPKIFPDLDVIHGGLLLEKLDLKYHNNFKSFVFSHYVDAKKESMIDLECQMKSRLATIKTWIDSLPLREEFTIEI